jgi:hypothetical protein
LDPLERSPDVNQGMSALYLLNVGRGRPLFAIHDIELHFLTLGQGLEAGFLNS